MDELKLKLQQKLDPLEQLKIIQEKSSGNSRGTSIIDGYTTAMRKTFSKKLSASSYTTSKALTNRISKRNAV